MEEVDSRLLVCCRQPTSGRSEASEGQQAALKCRNAVKRGVPESVAIAKRGFTDVGRYRNLCFQ